MAQCGSMTAGRRRRGRKTRKAGRKMRGGVMYGFNQGTPIGVGAASVGPADDGKFYNSETGQPRTGGRRKSRKSRRRQRGGASGVSMGTVGASFTGSGSRGIADYSQYTVQGNRF
jgi:hypothetical protein